MASIKIRFNTEYKSTPSEEYKWRIVVDGQESLAKNVAIKVPSCSTEDLLPSGIMKYHISCEGNVVWSDGNAIIEP